MELSVLREADHVVAVTDNMVRDFLEELEGENPENKFHVIENGYDEADFTGITAAELPAGFNLVHTGLFSAEGNPRRLWKVLAAEGNPRRLWKVLAELCRDLPGFGRDLHLTFAGKTDPEILAAVREAGLGGHLTDRGYIPHHEANRRQTAADLLLLPLREEPEAAGILTGKYFEYLAAGRPIAAFGPHGSILEYSLTATNTGKMFDWDEEIPLKAYITALYTRTLAFEPNTEAISAYTRRSLAGRYAELLTTKVLGNRKSS